MMGKTLVSLPLPRPRCLSRLEWALCALMWQIGRESKNWVKVTSPHICSNRAGICQAAIVIQSPLGAFLNSLV